MDIAAFLLAIIGAMVTGGWFLSRRRRERLALVPAQEVRARFSLPDEVGPKVSFSEASASLFEAKWSAPAGTKLPIPFHKLQQMWGWYEQSSASVHSANELAVFLQRDEILLALWAAPLPPLAPYPSEHRLSSRLFGQGCTLMPKPMLHRLSNAYEFFERFSAPTTLLPRERMMLWPTYTMHLTTEARLWGNPPAQRLLACLYGRMLVEVVLLERCTPRDMRAHTRAVMVLLQGVGALGGAAHVALIEWLLVQPFLQQDTPHTTSSALGLAGAQAIKDLKQRGLMWGAYDVWGSKASTEEKSLSTTQEQKDESKRQRSEVMRGIAALETLARARYDGHGALEAGALSVVEEEGGAEGALSLQEEQGGQLSLSPDELP